MTAALVLWTIYDHPGDFPDHFVARKFTVTAAGPTPTDDVVIGDLEDIRLWLDDQGAVRLLRDESDDPVIIETWMP